jgi:hypothetical protein
VSVAERLAAIAIIGLLCFGSFGLGHLLGQSDVRETTVVKTGIPGKDGGWFVNQPYFGKCAWIGDGASRVEACATD